MAWSLTGRVTLDKSICLCLDFTCEMTIITLLDRGCCENEVTEFMKSSKSHDAIISQ